ncbi:Tip elongation aberrant protein 1 [Fusarium oxysporum f. sp. albedinis]|nr:Tip elongation aberrant protein 1 [Fusarium oxysporum f. sp. albedinis]
MKYVTRVENVFEYRVVVECCRGCGLWNLGGAGPLALPYLTLPYYQGTLVAQAIPVKSGVWDVSDTFSTLSICCRFDRPEEIQGQGDCRVGAIHVYGTDWTGLGMTTTWSRY